MLRSVVMRQPGTKIDPRHHGILIGIDDEVLDALTAQATPFIDDPNAVLRRLLGLDAGAASARHNGQEVATASSAVSTRPKSSRSGRQQQPATRKPPRAPKGSLTPEERFERPILEALQEAGGSMPIRDALAAVGSRMADALNEHDRFRDDKGVARWEKRVPFVRLKLVERGLLDKDAPRGVWRLTESGRNSLAASS